jgi:AcrR family transcriptional regulator
MATPNRLSRLTEHAETRPPNRRGGSSRANNARNDILAAASRVFGRNGVPGTSMEDIAREAGVRSPSLYYYFANKDDILEELAAYSVKVSAVFATSQADGPGSPLHRLHQLLTDHFQRLVSGPFDLWFLVGAQGIADADSTPYFGDYQAWRDAVARLIQEAIRADEIGSCDPEHATQLIAGVVEAILEWRHFEREVDVDAAVKFAVQGLGPRVRPE